MNLDNITKLLEEKILNTELRDFAFSSSTKQTRPVIIELAVPTSKVMMTKNSRSLGTIKPRKVNDLTASELAEKKRVEDSAKKKLHQIIQSNLVWLKAGNAILARIEPDELQQVVRLNEVKSIKLRQE